MNIPLHECKLPEIPRINWKNDIANRQELSKKIKERNKLRKLHGETYSLWCTELYRLSIANMVIKTRV